MVLYNGRVSSPEGLTVQDKGRWGRKGSGVSGAKINGEECAIISYVLRISSVRWLFSGTTETLETVLRAILDMCLNMQHGYHINRSSFFPNL